ncbi:MAG: efflux RND transporter periplasmic adaptor subunit [Bacteroidetes bacterium]|nr:efflux RND transporter periplasmic adaptor subunit [Bacteroidota bacterium]NCQ12131.1 efflux RND transporter periplasmic adaptor subunit [Bacteroidota bacterium]
MNTLINIKSIAVFAVLLTTLISCNNQEKGTEQTTANDKTQKVEVVKPQKRSFIAEILITGTARPNQITTLYAMESGMLMQMRKDIGDRVKQGEILAVLENPELLQQQMKWQAETKAKKSNYERLNSVYEKTPALTNIQMVENAEAEYLSAKANLNGVNNRISFLTVKAPFSGTITKRFVDKGSMIQSGLSQSNPQALFELQEINPIRLTIPVPESDAVGIQKGMDVEVTLPELSGKSFMAKVSRTSNVLDPMSKTMQVEIDLENPDGKILSGMYAKVLMQIESRENILSLPMIAKVSHKNEDYVLAVVDGKVKRLPVKIGLSNQDYFEVLNDEITSETQVIVQGKGLVKPDQIVEPILKQE